ncbi:PREDICTED: LOC110773577 [Prunus dulcis]|uniref:PREDICTED: LOC110773577 n=1 Tax=Prunus dulcis TaxID=3755 RepID=A0A5E4GPV6_PRUDU|nr:PREDICTED: LOC110773577 [Prunus dulcis]
MICVHFGVRARSGDIISEPMGSILDTSVSKSVSQRRDAPTPVTVPRSMPQPQPRMPASSKPFPPAPRIETSSWYPSLQAIWDMQMLQCQQMQWMGTSIDAIWTHLQMSGQPGIIPGEDADADDDDDDESTLRVLFPFYCGPALALHSLHFSFSVLLSICWHNPTSVVTLQLEPSKKLLPQLAQHTLVSWLVATYLPL